MTPFCAAVDWGTSSFRLWAMSADGAVLAERQSEQGLSRLKPDDFESVLDDGLRGLGLPPDLPVIICGMAGAAQGWMEAPYLAVPVPLAEVPAAALRIPGPDRDVRILPGLAQRDPSRPDVIRGEETLLLGAHLETAVTGTVCLPGTHSKWARIEAGRVTGFRTAMTGELFALLATSSTLAHFIEPEDSGEARATAFADAVRQSLDSPSEILRALFSVRAGPLLGYAEPHDMAARLSGLLIGVEIAGMKALAEGPITLVSAGRLAKIYGRAFQAAGLDFRLCDSEVMVRAGLAFAAKSLWVEERG